MKLITDLDCDTLWLLCASAQVNTELKQDRLLTGNVAQSGRAYIKECVYNSECVAVGVFGFELPICLLCESEKLMKYQNKIACPF